ncbi:MAG: ABC transporter ATP-binding protein, partial [Chthoniobacterales bacterium]
MPAPAIELRGITKRCAQTIANDDVNFKIEAGEIHALAGENGAGKTTLARILYGMWVPDAGQIFLNGLPVSFRSSADAIAAGIGMVHQHFMLIPAFTVAENIVLGNEPRRAGIGLDGREAASTIRNLAEQFQLAADPDARAGDLAVGEQQRVEILKLLYRKASILIFDEPTAVLSPAETTNLFRVMRGLKEQGKTILLITHKLDEIMEIADRVTVMRRGKMIGERRVSDTSPKELARLMVGRDVDLAPERTASSPGGAVLTGRNLSVKRKRGTTALHDVSLEIHSGEILGIAGVEGNGQTELAEILAGIQIPDSGAVMLQNSDITPSHLRSQVAWIPEDRHQRAMVEPFTLSENLVLGFHRRAPYSSHGMLHWNRIADWATGLLQKYDV